MINKIADSITEALADIKDGSTVLIGGFGTSGIPAALIDGLVFEAGNATVRLRARRANFQHLHPSVQRVAGAHGQQPAQFIDARRAHA